MPKVKQRRQGFVLDMTPLVDIAFLLLTFFMFTAKFKSEAESEQKFTIERPKSVAASIAIPEKDAAIIKIGIEDETGDTAYFYTLTNENVRESIYRDAGVHDTLATKLLQKASTPEELDKFIVQTRVQAPRSTRYVVEADGRVKYSWIEDMMDVMRKRNATIFNFVTDKKAGE